MTNILTSLGLPNLQLTHDAQTNIARGFVLLKRKLAKSTTAYQYELWVRPEDFANYCKKLSDLGIKQASAEILEQFRMEEAIPRYGTDIRDRDLPQETAQTHALNFNKGCYLGQEIVERIHSRGQVHRTFTQFTLTGDLPTLPAPLTANEKPAGELTSAARIGDTIFALGTIRRGVLDTHQPIAYPGGTAVPR
jgi:folate-binding protein YgfZ